MLEEDEQSFIDQILINKNGLNPKTYSQKIPNPIMELRYLNNYFWIKF